ncbi:MAG TPA: cysteine desulfurase family protein [Xanthobacteraceae bacterium]|nr:cysteine desulfurase family protein [Xanthobacteraceae bacterium]
MATRVYLDWNATAPLRPEARAAMLAAAETVGNPSSVHGAGRAARHLVETARAQVAALVGADPQDVIFTSGGTEANVLALDPTMESEERKGAIGRLLVSAIEHPSVRSGGRFPPNAMEDIPVTAIGIVDLTALQQRLAVLVGKGIRPLVSVMLANNETGVIQPIRDVCRLVRAAAGFLHVDAVQVCGRIEIDFKELGSDLLTVSSHKLGGPMGVGALVKRADLRLTPLITGGGQERHQRAGTENVPGIAGFGAAAAAVCANLSMEASRMAALRQELEAGIRRIAPDAVIFGADSERLPNTTLFSVPGMKAETAVIAFDLEGIAVSSGAACSSGKVSPSHVLAAMGVPQELARGAVRVSLGFATTEKDISAFLAAWAKLAGALYKGRGIAA